MLRFISRISALALTVGALALTPALALANDLDPGSGSGEPRAELVSLQATDLDLLIAEAMAGGDLTTDTIRFLEDNVIEQAVARPAIVEGGMLAEIAILFDTDHVTGDMIRFYEANVFELDDGSASDARMDASYPQGLTSGLAVE